MTFYLCLSDVINKVKVSNRPHIDADYETAPVRQFCIYSFIRGHVYAGQPDNHPETKESGVLFTNHAGQDHFISAGFLKEHFEVIQ